EDRTPAAPAPARPGARRVPASGRPRAQPVLRCPAERPRAERVSGSDGAALVARLASTESRPPSDVAPHGRLRRPLASDPTYLSSLSDRALHRHHPRQEPDAVMPHVRIRGGGGQRWSFLLRLLLERRMLEILHRGRAYLPGCGR